MMRRLTVSNILALAIFASGVASAQAPHDPARLFPYEAPIELPNYRGLVRLAISAEVLERSHADLSDLRIHDDAGTERPYVVESGARASGDARVYEITPVAVTRRIEDGESLASLWREHLVLQPPPQVMAGRWTLWLDSGRGAFVRDVTIYRRDGETREEIARATLFRMRSPLRERLFVDLPRLPDDAELEVQVVGEGGYIEPSVRLSVLRAPLEPTTLSLPLEEIARTTRDGRTTIELVRPSGVTADRLRLLTTSGNFFREVRVLDLPVDGAPREVGRAALFRVQELDGAENIEIDVDRAVGARLRIEIDDGDSPALTELSFVALVRQPSLLFESDGSSLTLRCGGGRALAPRYDIQRIIGTGLGDRLLARQLPEATIGSLSDNPRFDDGPALRFAMRPGRAPDPSVFTHVATLTVADATEGLSRVRLPVSVLAAARADLADLRIVDGEGRQWPYLRAPDEPDVIDTEIGVPREDSRASRYEIELPASWATVSRVDLMTDAPYVSRDFELFGLDEHGRRVSLSRGRLSRGPNEAGPIELAITPRRVSGLELVVVDGDDAPLSFSAVRVTVPSPTLYLAAPDGSYRVLVGDPEADPPEYEIDRARALVLSVRSVDAVVGAADANPAHVEPPWYDSSDTGTWLVWLVLALAILVLGALTWRVARQAGSDEDEAETGGGDEASGADSEEPAAVDPEAVDPNTGPTSF